MCGCCFPKLFAICKVAENCQNKFNFRRDKNPREWLPPVSHPSPPSPWCSDKNGWMTKNIYVSFTTSSKETTLDSLRCQHYTLGCCGDPLGQYGDTISVKLVVESITMNLIKRGWPATHFINCGNLVPIDRPGYWIVVLCLHWLFKLFQTQSKGNLCSTKVSSERRQGLFWKT